MATAAVEALAVDEAEEEVHSTTTTTQAAEEGMIQVVTMTRTHPMVGMTGVCKGRARKIRIITRDHHRRLTTLVSSGMRRRLRPMLMKRTVSRRMAGDMKAQAPTTIPTMAPVGVHLQARNDHEGITSKRTFRTRIRVAMIMAVEGRRQAMR